MNLVWTDIAYWLKCIVPALCTCPCTSLVFLPSLMHCAIRTSDWLSSGCSRTLPSLGETLWLWPYLDRVQVPYQWHCTWQPAAVKGCLARFRHACMHVDSHALTVTLQSCMVCWTTASIDVTSHHDQVLVVYSLVPALPSHSSVNVYFFLFAVTVWTIVDAFQLCSH